MRLSKVLSACLCLATLGVAQEHVKTFECQAVGAFPAFAGPADCEGFVGRAAAGGTVAISNAAGCSMPTQGANYAILTGEANAGSLGAGQMLARPFAATLTEVRLPLPVGITTIALDYTWNNAEVSSSSFNDGFDLSVCAVGGDRLVLLARGDTFSFASGCSAVQSISVSFAPTSAGAYLSLVNYNEGDTAVDSTLRVDNIRLTRSTVGFDCQALGAFPTAGGDCGLVTGTTGDGGAVTVATAPNCGMPTSGAQYARVQAGAFINIAGGGTIPRPLAANVSEVRVAVPTGATHVSFDYSFINNEGNPTTFVDGFDVAVVDATGALIFQCVQGDATTTAAGCNGPAHFNAAMTAAPAGAYLSLVCFNSQDTAVDSVLLVDSICFVGRPRLTFSAPLGPGSLASRIDCANPFDFVVMPLTLAPGAFPFGAFYGVDISLLDLFSQVSAGAPFFTTTDAKGVYEFGPIPGLPSGLTLYATVLDGLTSPNPRVGLPAAFTIP